MAVLTRPGRCGRRAVGRAGTVAGNAERRGAGLVRASRTGRLGRGAAPDRPPAARGAPRPDVGLPPGPPPQIVPDAALDPDLARPPDQDLHRLLDAVPQASLLAEPVRDGDGTVLDLAVVIVNESAARHPYHPEQLAGRAADGHGLSLREAYPGLWTEPVAAAVAEVLRTGHAARDLAVRWEGAGPDGSARSRRERLTVHRLGRRLLLLWTDDRTEEVARAAQRIARVGWAEWNLRDGRLDVSPGLAVLLGRTPDTETMTTHQVLGRVTETARPALYRELDRLFSTGADIDVLTELYGVGRPRRIRLVAEVVRDEDGPIEGLRAVLQDVTELYESQRRLREQQEETERQARRADAEHSVVQRLQDALQPRSATLVGLGVTSAVAYRPAEGRVGGDWFKVRQLPDGRALLAVGDARGHGLDAVALMSMLRHALAGLAFTGALVESLGGWLNRIACDDSDESTATAIVSRYYPDRHLLRWICAGHPPPVLLRDGRASLLPAELGPPFGVLPVVAYRAVETHVRAGDTVFFYTDGLIERRDQDIDVRLDALCAAVEAHAAEPVLQTLVDVVVRDMSGPLSEDDATLLAFRFDR
ncbi:putative serine/threonine protein phosphatase [Kitasatospora cheerisanensis KCTC 2395]|uniref:Putative serine/threonine protein phosphatase n=1 Tax=Kitasatospora cheerisanensis KCTC 2395 TaxID=1348663 RepID=A0A066Z0E7_9ACTN|nr:putative serine/threonine protein phosphatase [Kitasatospora cheerisanensis KCTC 2395]